MICMFVLHRARSVAQLTLSLDLSTLREQGLRFRVTASDYAEDLDKCLYTPAEYVVETGRRKVLSVVQQQLASRTGEAASSSTDRPPSLIIGADTVVVRDEHILEKPHSPSEAHDMIRSLSGRSHVVMTGVTLWIHGLTGLSIAALTTPLPSTSTGPCSSSSPTSSSSSNTTSTPATTTTSTPAAVSSTSMTLLQQLRADLCLDNLQVTACEDQPDAVVFSFYEQTRVCFAQLGDDEIAAYCASEEPYDKAGGYGYQGIAGCLITEIQGCYFNVVGFPLNRFARLLDCLLRHQKY